MFQKSGKQVGWAYTFGGLSVWVVIELVDMDEN